MRMSPNDTPDTKVVDPERRCVLSGERGGKSGLTRLALSPDGVVAPDVRARAPGRGAWIGVDKATFNVALAKGKLKGALIRAFKTSAVTLPDDLAERIEAALERATLDRLGLEARAGNLIIGAEKIEQAARSGQLRALLHAEDAAEDGRRKLDQAWRVGRGQEGSGTTGLVIAANRTILAIALGRDNVVHIGITDHAAMQRVMGLLTRWHKFIGRSIGDDSCDDTSPSSSANLHENEGF